MNQFSANGPHIADAINNVGWRFPSDRNQMLTMNTTISIKRTYLRTTAAAAPLKPVLPILALPIPRYILFPLFFFPFRARQRIYEMFNGKRTKNALKMALTFINFSLWWVNIGWLFDVWPFNASQWWRCGANVPPTPFDVTAATAMAAKHRQPDRNLWADFIIILIFSLHFASAIMARRLFMTLVALFFLPLFFRRRVFHFYWCEIYWESLRWWLFYDAFLKYGYISKCSIRCGELLSSMCACDVLAALTVCAVSFGTYHTFNSNMSSCAFFRHRRYQLVAIVV